MVDLFVVTMNVMKLRSFGVKALLEIGESDIDCLIQSVSVDPSIQFDSSGLNSLQCCQERLLAGVDRTKGI